MIIHFEADSNDVEVVVKTSNGRVFDLDGATVEAVARKKNGASASIPSQIVNAAQGKIVLRMPQDKFRAGEHRLQVRVTKGTNRQTVIDEDLTILSSIRVRA